MTSAPRSMLDARRLPLAVVIILCVATGWGLSYSLAKLVTEAGADPLGLTFLQGMAGAAIMLPYALLRRRRIILNREYITFYAVAGALGTVLPSLVLYTAAPQLPAGILAIVSAMVPLMTYAFALGLRVEGFAALRLSGIALGFLAMLMIVLPDASLPAPGMALWVLFTLLVPACYSGENLYLAIRRPEGSDAGALLCGMLATGAVMTLPVVWATDSWTSLAPPWGSTEWIIIAMVVINAVSYLMFIELVRFTGPVFAAQAGYLVTAAGVLWGIVIFGEAHSAWVWGAMAVMFAALALVNPRPTDRRGSGAA